jgi:Mrp family chromosome partitioning ATPase
MEPIDYAAALRRSWRLILVFALLGAVIAVLVPVSQPKRVKAAFPYEATAIVGGPPQSAGSPLRAGVSSSQILFYATQSETATYTVANAGLNVAPAVSPGYLSASIVASSGAGAGPIKRNTPTSVVLTGYGETPSAAVTMANSYAEVTGDFVGAALDTLGKTSGAISGYTVLRPAQSGVKIKGGKASLGASRKVRGLGGLIVGAVLAAGLVLLRELLDKRLRSAARTQANFGFPVVAEIPLVVPAEGLELAMMPAVDVRREPESPGAEAYRMLRMSVILEPLAPLTDLTDPFALGFESSVGDTPGRALPAPTMDTQTLGDRKVVLVASAGPEPTRPQVAANLAAIYAEAGQRVVVISTSDLGPLPGAIDGQFAGEVTPEDIQAQLEPSRLEYVSRLNLGRFVATSGQLVNRAPAIFDALRGLCDLVIVEVPPILAVHHAEALAHSVDVVLVVAECKFTTFDDARQAGDQLRRMGAPVLGVVLTNIRIPHSDVRHLGLPRSTVIEPETDPEEDHGRHAIEVGVGSTSGTDSPTRS